MELLSFKNFPAFELLDTGDGFRLERWGEIILSRPDPQIIWSKTLPAAEWHRAHAAFIPGHSGEKGKWKINKPVPDRWTIAFNRSKFHLHLSPFKHTGLFAEQAANWEWMLNQISNSPASTAGGQLPTSDNGQQLKILNLFAYTGGATVVLANAGAQVTHVDASKPSITWANENARLNNLPPDSIRWMLDDAAKFVKREVKRGARYDGIIMDPPAFGRSPSGKVWKFNEHLPELLKECVQLLSPQAKFLLINGYATNSSALALQNLLEDTTKNLQGKVESGELCLKQNSGRMISTGIFARWSRV